MTAALKPEAFLAKTFGPDYRSKCIDYLATQASPLCSADFADGMNVTVQTASKCLVSLTALDLLGTYHKVGPRGGFELCNSKSGAAPRVYYLMTKLMDLDKNSFVPT